MERPRSYWQSHDVAGYRAKVTIEWEIPAHLNEDDLPAWRLGKAEEIAEELITALGPKTRDMVEAMRGNPT